jgi:hypothetical protein
MDMDVGGRVMALVERYFEGNVFKAARTWKVAQPTLQRLVTGKVKEPRADLLQRIAKYHGTTIEWLLEGVGPDPYSEHPYPIVERRQFEDVVGGLVLEPDVRKALLALPSQIFATYSTLNQWGMFDEGRVPQPVKTQAAARHAMWRAQALELSMWAEFLYALWTTYGTDRLSAKLNSELDRIRLGFQPFAMSLLQDPTVAPVLPRLWAEFAGPDPGPDGPHRHAAFSGSPAHPPLDARLPVEQQTKRRGRPPEHSKPRSNREEDDS